MVEYISLLNRFISQKPTFILMNCELALSVFLEPVSSLGLSFACMFSRQSDCPPVCLLTTSLFLAKD